MASLLAVICFETDDDDAFWAAFDEDRFVANLPVWGGWLLVADDTSRVEFGIETDSAEQFRNEFDERALAAVLPEGSWPRLVDVVPQVTLTDRLRAAWRRLTTRLPL